MRYHIAKVDADTEADAAIQRLVAVVSWHLLLHLDSAAHRTVDAVERHQQRIAAGLHHPAAMLTDRRIDQRSS